MCMWNCSPYYEKGRAMLVSIPPATLILRFAGSWNHYTILVLWFFGSFLGQFFFGFLGFWVNFFCVFGEWLWPFLVIHFELFGQFWNQNIFLVNDYDQFWWYIFTTSKTSWCFGFFWSVLCKFAVVFSTSCSKWSRDFQNHLYVLWF